MTEQGRNDRRSGGRSAGKGADRDQRGRGGQSRSSNSSDRGSRSSSRAPQRTQSTPRKPAGPPLPPGVDLTVLPKEVAAEFRSLPKDIAGDVLGQLAAAELLLAEAPEQALIHAQAARSIAPRFAIVREAVGIAAYYAEEWQTALVELRAARRINGNSEYLPMISDCERALGRHAKARESIQGGLDSISEPAIRAELLIISAGMLRDEGKLAAAQATLEVAELQAKQPARWLARLRYLYADLLEEAGQLSEAYHWFVEAASADVDGDTDAGERVLQLDGTQFEAADSDVDEAEVQPAIAPAAGTQ